MTIQVPRSTAANEALRFPITDLGLLIPMGVYPGISSVNVFGRNRNCADGTEEEIYSVEDAATFPATALMVKISQTADAADVRGENVIIKGVDINWNAVTQTAIIDGSNSTTPVVLSTALLRVNSMRMSADTVIATPVRLHNAAEDKDYATILAGEERATQAHYSVPLGFTAYMTGYWATRNNSVRDDADTVDIQLYGTDWAHDDDPQQTLVESFMIDPMTGTYISRAFSQYRKFTAQTDIILTATAASTVADVSGGFNLILVEDALYA